MKKAVYLSLAALLLLVALAGLILPVLPCTPFLLLASYLVLRVSPGLHERLMNSALFGSLLRDWHFHRGIRRSVQHRALAIVVVVLAISMLTVTPSLAWILGLTACGAIGIAVILHLPVIDGSFSKATERSLTID